MTAYTSSGAVVGGSEQEHWFLDVNHLARGTAWLHTPAREYASLGVVLFAGMLLVSWWLARGEGDLRRVAATLWAPVGALLALGINQLVAGAVGEPRPYAVLPGTVVLVARSGDPSFPSDHAVMAGAVVVGVWVAHRRLGIVVGALAVLMAFARVYVGAHFPLDVVAGLALGAAVAGMSYALARRPVEWLVGAAARTGLRPLLVATGAGVAR